MSQCVLADFYVRICTDIMNLCEICNFIHLSSSVLVFFRWKESTDGYILKEGSLDCLIWGSLGCPWGWMVLQPQPCSKALINVESLEEANSGFIGG